MKRRWIDEEKKTDDDGYKGGCPNSFSSTTAANPSGDRAAAVYGQGFSVGGRRTVEI